MYCKLKKNFLLRGWQRLPTGIIDKNTGNFEFLPMNIFETLKICNGTVDENDSLFSEEQHQHLKFLEQYGFIEKIENPSPIDSEQKYKTYPNRFLHGVHWSITGKCNARCKHCYMSASNANASELSDETCMKIIDELAECGVQQVTITGGEALVRKNFFDIIDKLIEKNIHVTSIMTNGLLVNEKFLDKLLERKIRPSFNISFDGTNGCHDWLRGIKGAEKTVINAFKICNEKGFVTSSIYCLHKGNIHAIRDSIKLLADIGVNNLKIIPMSPYGEGSSISNKALKISEMYDALIDYIPKYFEDDISMPVYLTGILSAYPNKKYDIGFCKMPEDQNCDEFCICTSARNNMHINAEGRMIPCTLMDYTNIINQFPVFGKSTLKDTLNDSEYMNFVSKKIKDYLKRNPECDKCKYRNRCAGGCRGHAILYAMLKGSSDIWGHDPYRCTFFKNGYYEKIIALMENLKIKQIGA